VTPEHQPTGTPPTSPQPTARSAGWTAQRIRALGAVTDLPTAGAILGLSRSVAYDLAARDQFPVPVIRAGTRYRIPVAALLSALHIPLEAAPVAGLDHPATPRVDHHDRNPQTTTPTSST
jgi:hypothetical protein